MLQKILLASLLSITAYETQAQHIWTESSEGFDQNYGPGSIIEDSEGTLYLTAKTVNLSNNQISSKIFTSTNNAESWEELEYTGLDAINSIGPMVFLDDLLIMGGSENGPGTPPKIYTSTNKGADWTLSAMEGIEEGYPHLNLYKIKKLNNGDLLLAAGEDVGDVIADFEPRFYTSSDQGQSWQSLTVNGLEEMSGIYFLENYGDFMILGGNITIDVDDYDTKGGLFISTDQGLNWTALENDWDTDYYPTSFQVDSSGRLYMFVQRYNLTPRYMFYTSTDQGESWTEVETEGLSDVASVGAFFVQDDTFILGSLGSPSELSSLYTGDKTSVGISEAIDTNDGVQVYPSHFNEQIHIAFEDAIEKVAHIQLFTITGQKILEREAVTEQHFTLNTQELPAGSYVVKLVYDNEVKTVKVIK